MARMKKRRDLSTNRESDKLIIRLPTGMRGTIKELADQNGRSMNTEAVEALALYLDRIKMNMGIMVPLTGLRDVEIREGGFDAISKRLEVAVQELERLHFGDIDLEPYLSDQRSQGFDLTRNEAIRKIVRTYLDEHGYGGRVPQQFSDLIGRLAKDERKGGK